ncbi:MAG TPA: response regulator [Ktedonobacterales bacterium]|nr:response regulator [Ktedonobacterales bacterium]
MKRIHTYPPTAGALALRAGAQSANASVINRQRPAPSTRPRRLSPHPITADQHILIVEDDARVADVIRTALELENEPRWAVHVAREGAHALDLAKLTPPQVVLLDVGLPGLEDGAEVYRRLRANPDTEATRVLFLTAATSHDLHQQGIDGGVLMRKPFDVQDVVRLVRAMLV